MSFHGEHGRGGGGVTSLHLCRAILKVTSLSHRKSITNTNENLRQKVNQTIALKFGGGGSGCPAVLSTREKQINLQMTLKRQG